MQCACSPTKRGDGTGSAARSASSITLTLGMFCGIGASRLRRAAENVAPGASRSFAPPPPTHIETEVFACGRLPLAFSARCSTARHFSLRKDNCEFAASSSPTASLLNPRGQTLPDLNGIRPSPRGCTTCSPTAPRSLPTASTSCASARRANHRCDREHLPRRHRPQSPAGRSRRAARWMLPEPPATASGHGCAGAIEQFVTE